MATPKNEYFPQTTTPPGFTLAEKLEELGIEDEAFALLIQEPVQNIKAIKQGACTITPDLATKFEEVLKIPASFWLMRERGFDEYMGRREK